MDVPTSNAAAVQRADITIGDFVVEQTVRFSLEDARSEATALLGDLPESQQRRVAKEAWQIGLRALGNAQALARESKLEDIGKTLLNDVDEVLGRHVATQVSTIKAQMDRYFDPRDGEVHQRLAAFLADDGVLKRVLAEHLDGEQSVLARTLAAQVGEHSELFKRLDPEHKGGVIQLFEERLSAVLRQGQRDMAQALDPAAPDGALARVLTSLRKEMEESQRRGADQLQKAVAALDANDENSAISRLMKETEKTQQALLLAINPAKEGSAMATVRKVIAELLTAQGQSTQELLKLQDKRQQELERLIRETVTRTETRKESDASSPRGGTTFEEQVVEFATQVCGQQYIVEPTGHNTGAIPRCKVGDALVTFAPDSAFEGCSLVIEAKRDGSYNATKMLAEMDKARKNRGAEVGLFVLSRSSAWSGASEFARYGHTILVLWDPDDRTTDAFLKAAMFSALFMATRRRSDADPGDISALRDVDKLIGAELERIAKMRKEVARISRASEVLAGELHKGEKKLHDLLGRATKTMAALNVELHDREVEIDNPITVPETVFEA